jgi:hypothetical protein
VEFLAGRGGAVLPSAVLSGGDRRPVAEKSRYFPEKTLSFSPRLRYNKGTNAVKRAAKGGGQTWRKKRPAKKSPALSCCWC